MMAAARAPRQSSEAEFAAYGRVCERLAGFDAAVSLEWIDGWLAALACASLRPAGDAWLEAMLGGTFERVFADPPDRAQALAALKARLAVLRDELDAEALLEQPDQLRLDPMLFEWTDEDVQRALAEGVVGEADVADLQTGAVWARGVLEGLAALPALGVDAARVDDEAEADYAELLMQIEALTMRPGSDEWRTFAAQHHPGREPGGDDLIAEACYALQDLRLWWLDHAPRPEPRRAEAMPGRNDPCPCGSGRKFKKCHGAATAGG